MHPVGRFTVARDEDARLFSQIDVFEPLSFEEVASLARRTPVMHLERHQELRTVTKRGGALFLLLEGRIRLYKMASTRELTLSHVEAGTIFGGVVTEGAGSRDGHAGVHAETIKPSKIALISRETFGQIVMEHPEVGLKAIELLAGRLSLYAERMADLGLKGVPARLASLILHLASSEGVVTSEGISISDRYTHDELGAMIGTRRVAVTRALGVLRSEGAVILVQRQIHIKDMEILGQIARGG